MKICPYCESNLSDTAKKCKFCGERVQTNQTRQITNNHIKQKKGSTKGTEDIKSKNSYNVPQKTIHNLDNNKKDIGTKGKEPGFFKKLLISIISTILGFAGFIIIIWITHSGFHGIARSIIGTLLIFVGLGLIRIAGILLVWCGVIKDKE